MHLAHPSLRPYFIVGVTGKRDLVPGAFDEAHQTQLRSIELRIRAHVQSILDWLRGAAPTEGQGQALDSQTGFLVPFDRKAEKAEKRRRENGQPPSLWPCLGLEHTPILVLSCLAPGVDTIVAQAALDYAAGKDLIDSSKPQGPRRLVFVRGHLPFPLPLYPRSTSFSEPTGDEAKQAAWGKVFSDTEAQIRAQTWTSESETQPSEAVPAFVEQRDLFEVELGPLAKGLRGAVPATSFAEHDLKQNSAKGCPMRHLRYRAAGESVAIASHLLIAIYDSDEEEQEHQKGVQKHESPACLKPNYQENLKNPFNPSTGAVVHVARSGPTFELLPFSNNLTWADQGPALHIPLKRLTAAPEIGLSPLRLLFPFDLRERPTKLVERERKGGGGKLSPDERKAYARKARVMLCLPEPSEPVYETDDALLAGSSELLPNERWNGWQRLVQLAARTEEFNAKPLDPKLTEKKPALPELFPSNHEFTLSDATSGHLERVEPLALLRQRASVAESIEKDQSTDLLWRLLRLIFVAALCVGLYEQWPSAQPSEVGSHGPPAGAAWIVLEGPGSARWLLLAGALAALTRSGWLFWRHRRSEVERRRFDWRALAEGLRVQAYWAAAGVPDTVGANYMQRQRGEMDWIRQAIGGVAMPLEQWTRSFEALTRKIQHEVLERVRGGWIRGQLSYFCENSIQNHFALNFQHHWAWTFAAAGLLNLIGKFLYEAVVPVSSAVHGHELGAAWRVLLLLWIPGLLLVLAQLWIRSRHPHPASPHAAEQGHGPSPRLPFAGWLLLRPLLFGYALILAGAVFCLAHLLPTLIGFIFNADPAPFPNPHQAWIVLTGLLLLFGGLFLAFSERSFFSDHARQYTSMYRLYDAADRRYTQLLSEFQTADEHSAPQILAALHDLLYQLGREALDENTDWLILHRSRPLEPFMAP